MPHPEFVKEDILESKMSAVLAYLPVLCMIPRILEKKNPFVLAQGKQGLVLFLFALSGVIAAIRSPMAEPLGVSGMAEIIIL